jgi:hypothetical protein
MGETVPGRARARAVATQKHLRRGCRTAYPKAGGTGPQRRQQAPVSDYDATTSPA